MLCDKKESLESKNFVDGVDFTQNDPCIFVVYPGGAAGDLLISIIDKHYIRTGCEYYGIGDNGRVHMFTTDYESLDLNEKYIFDQQWFYDLASSLGSRNLNYSLLDQVIFGCHMHRPQQIQYILDTFPQCKIIRIAPIDEEGNNLISALAKIKINPDKKLMPKKSNFEIVNYDFEIVNHDRVLTVPFGALFTEELYYKWYDQVIKFLNLNGRLICFDYVKYYLSKQHHSIRSLLVNYSKNI